MLSRLCVSSHPAAAWAEVVEPWLRRHGASWREQRAILAPNAVWLAALKAGAVSAGLPIIGLEWHTPGRWRAQALATLPGSKRPVALREDLHLLLELAAQNLPENPLARAYSADPALFQELLDALECAGWDATVLPDAAARELAQAAVKLRSQTGWLTAAAADNALREATTAGAMPQLGKHLLIAGFGPGDWPLSALLEAAVAAYEKSEMALDVPEKLLERELNRPASLVPAWVGRWEEKINGGAEWLEAPAEVCGPFAALADNVAGETSAKKIAIANAPAPMLWLAENLQGEADLATAQALAFLHEDENARVGIVVGSAASPLAREVAARLTACGCPHYDATGYLPGRESAQALFEAWLDWQDDGRLAGFVAWVRAAGRHQLLGEKSAAAIEKSLREATQALFTDDPAVLTAWLQAAPNDALEARAFLAEWPRLPESARWEDFLAQIIAVSAKFRWPAEPALLTQRAEGWQGKLAVKIPRAAIVRWVRAVTRVPGRTRAALGREPWARLQIIDAASAAAQTWTHLVLGGLQHGEWPADQRDTPLLGDASIEKLNHQSGRQGPQGEGHWTVIPGRGLLLTTADRRRLERANFARLLLLPTKGLALTAREADPVDGRRARLSEYFWATARATLGRLPSEADWQALAEASRARRAWAAEALAKFSSKQFPQNAQAAPNPEQTAHAHRARRDNQSKFDEFSFCLRAAPAVPLRLSCKAWDDAARRPGASWFKHLLRAAPRWDPAEEDATRMGVGLWAHEWSRPGPKEMGESYPLPNEETWRQFAQDAAKKFQASAQAAFSTAGRPLPESWLDAHADALRLAGQWIAALAATADWPQALAEISLPPNLLAALPGGVGKISLSGRMDLVLFPRATVFANEKLNGMPAWVLDFKTGGDKALSLKGIAKGEGVQLALYALALAAMGASTVEMTLLNADAELRPQMTGAELAAPELAGQWRLLADFALCGQWGEICDLEDEHARPGDYPTATLPVPVEILRQKWKLTHEVSP